MVYMYRYDLAPARFMLTTSSQNHQTIKILTVSSVAVFSNGSPVCINLKEPCKGSLDQICSNAI